MKGATRAWSLALVALGIAAPLPAQRLAPKRSLSSAGPSGCAGVTLPSVPPAAAAMGTDAETQQLIDRGQEAALQGEHAAARDAFARALARAPTNARLAYYLGREYEALRDTTAAVREYCRYLVLTPSAPDGDEVRNRIQRLVPASELARLERARASFRSGVTLLERREYQAADSIFGAVATVLPGTPEAHYNRALARAARGAREPAVDEFERYLELAPTAPDRAAVLDAMARLQVRGFAPEQALASGLVVPGMGQMFTGRPAIGVAVLGTVAGILAFGLATDETMVVRTFEDPFGNPYVDSLPRTERPNFALAATGAAVIWAGAAYEAWRFARRSRSQAESILELAGGGSSAARLVLVPGAHGWRVGIRVTR